MNKRNYIRCELIKKELLITRLASYQYLALVLVFLNPVLNHYCPLPFVSFSSRKLLVLAFYSSLKSLDQANSGEKASKYKQEQEATIPREDHHRKPSVIVFLLLVLMLMSRPGQSAKSQGVIYPGD